MTNAERCLNRYRTACVGYFASIEGTTNRTYWCDRANRYAELARKRYGYRIRTIAAIETQAERYVASTSLQLA